MYHLIVNPQGGKGKSMRALKNVEDTLKVNGIKEYEVHKTEYKGHASQIASELSRVPDTQLLVLGGDGSFNEVLNGIENFENITLGLIPCGTGNDFVRAAGYPTTIKGAMDVILSNRVSFVDFIQLDDRRCLNVLGAGMDVDVLLRYAEMKMLGGKIKYYFSLFHTLAHTRFHKLRLTVDDGEPIERNVFMIGVGNGKSIGGGMPICPNALVDDGELNIVVVNEMKKSRIPAELPGFLSGKHIKKSYTEEFNGKSIRLEALDDSQFEVDGEVFDGKSVNCSVVTKTLKVFR